MKKLKIITKQLIKDGKWNCSTTHDCYDVLEVSETIQEAQQKITNTLKHRGYKGELDFEEPKPYIYSKTIGQSAPYIGYANWRIDKGIV